MKKILVLTVVHKAFDTRIFHKQAKSLAKAGYDVTLVAQHNKNETIDGIKIIGLPKPRNRFQRMFGLTFKVLSIALKEKSDVYHFHDPELIPVGLILKLLGEMVIYDVHEDYPESIKMKGWIPSYIRNAISTMFDIFEKACCNFFDAVIPATEGISKRFKRRRVIIHNYPIIEYSNMVSRREEINGYYKLIYCGGLYRERGIAEIIKSLGYINENLKVRLLLLGWFTDPNFEREIRALCEFSRVDFLGHVSYDKLFFYLLSADVGMVLFYSMPNHVEAMPNKLFEYMSAGLPVIASNFPLWREIIEGNNCGVVVDPLNPKEIAKAIEYLLERPDLMEEMGRNGRKAVLEKYSWEQESKKLLDLYACLLNRKAIRKRNSRPKWK